MTSKRPEDDGLELVALFVLLGSFLYRALAQRRGARAAPVPALVREPGRACRCCSL
jgi:hypothetical protein